MPHDDASCPLYDKVEQEVNDMIEAYKVAYADSTLDLKEAFSLITRASAGLVSIVKSIKGAGTSDEEVSNCLKHCIEKFYDEVIAPIDIKPIPNFIEGFVDSTIKGLLMEFVDPAIRWFVDLFPANPDNIDDGVRPSPNVINAMAAATRPGPDTHPGPADVE